MQLPFLDFPLPCSCLSWSSYCRALCVPPPFPLTSHYRLTACRCSPPLRSTGLARSPAGKQTHTAGPPSRAHLVGARVRWTHALLHVPARSRTHPKILHACTVWHGLLHPRHRSAHGGGLCRLPPPGLEHLAAELEHVSALVQGTAGGAGGDLARRQPLPVR